MPALSAGTAHPAVASKSQLTTCHSMGERDACYVPDRQSLRHPLPSSLATPGDREMPSFSTGQRKVQRGGHGAQSRLPTLRPASGPPTACVPAPAPPPASPPRSLSHATCPQAAVRTRPLRLHLNSIQKGSSNSWNSSESLGQQERLYKRQAAQHGSLFPTCGTPRTITGTGAASGPALALGARVRWEGNWRLTVRGPGPRHTQCRLAPRAVLKVLKARCVPLAASRSDPASASWPASRRSRASPSASQRPG